MISLAIQKWVKNFRYQFYIEKKSRNSMKNITILVNVEFVCHETRQNFLAEDDTARSFVLSNSKCYAFYTISTPLEIHRSWKFERSFKDNEIHVGRKLWNGSFYVARFLTSLSHLRRLVWRISISQKFVLYYVTWRKQWWRTLYKRPTSALKWKSTLNGCYVLQIIGLFK